MPLNKQKGNMYPWVTHTWNVIKGKCPHDCSYCYMKIYPQKDIRFDESELKTDLGNGNTIFVGSSCDMFAQSIPANWIHSILNHLATFPDNIYLFQSKNPKRFSDFLNDFPEKTILGTTIETNRDTGNFSKAPTVQERYLAMKELNRRIKISNNAKTNPNFGMKGKHHSEKSKKRMSASHNGQIPWIKDRKGVWKHTEEHKKKMSKRMSGKNNPFYGKTHTEESKKKIKLFYKGMTSPRKGVKLPEEQIEKIASKLRGRKPSKETIKRRLRRRTPSSLEKKMIKIINKYNLPYKFVGNGKFFIENKNPDFINVNGEKIAIEVFYRKHKEQFGGDVDKWKEDRRKIFDKYGWKLLFFDETRVNEKIKDVLK